MTPTSTAPVSADDKQNLTVTVKDILKEQQESIAYLKMKVELLKGKISELKGSNHITQTINTLLESNIDDQEQNPRGTVPHD